LSELAPAAPDEVSPALLRIDQTWASLGDDARFARLTAAH
jgi:hypothetical protein